MVFTAEKNTLSAAVKTAAAVVNENAPLEVIRGILLEATEDGSIHITGTDSVSTIQKRISSVHTEESGSLILPAILFADIIRRLPEDTVSIQQYKGSIIIRSGECSFQIAALPGEQFPEINLPFPENTISVSGLHPLIKNTVYATSDNQKEFVNQCVRLIFSHNTSRALATDNYRMTEINAIHCADGELDVIIHKKALLQLQESTKAGDEFFVGVSGPRVVFFNRDIIFTTGLIAATFQDISKFIKDFSGEYRARADVKEIYKALDSASVCMRAEDRCIGLAIDKDSLRFFSDCENGKAKSAATAFECVPTPESGFYYIPDFLKDYLSRGSGPAEIFINKMGFLLIQSNQKSYALAPRAKSKAKPKKEKIKKEKAA